MTRVLFVNSSEPSCGVHQLGLNFYRVLKASGNFLFHYCAPTRDAELFNFIDDFDIDLVLYNFYPCTMQWLSLRTLDGVRSRGLKQVSIFHEVPITGFDAYIYPDPTFQDCSKKLNRWYSVGRALPKAEKVNYPDRSIPVIGTAGFGFTWKGHARLARMVVEQFAEAILRMHIPFAKYGDESGDGARAIAQECRQIVSEKPGIQLEVDHQFMSPELFVEWLSQNDLNAYLYEDTGKGRGIASTSDHALAARKPIAITRTWMFRHLFDCRGIFVEDSSLKEIMARGAAPLIPIYKQFDDLRILERMEEILISILSGTEQRNRLLTNQDRDDFGPLIQEMIQTNPEMMGRKIPQANVQQAWILASVREANVSKILSIGCFEDTAAETLLKDGIEITGIDPCINYDLSGFIKANPDMRFDCVFATSVLEHVEDDEKFLREMCDVLNPDGVGLLTMDYRNDFQAGQPVPATDVRLYTASDIQRLGKVLESKGCYFVDKPDFTGEPDFVYQGHKYSFYAMTFKKL